MNQDYFELHLLASKSRLVAWEELLDFLARFIHWHEGDVLDAGCGRGELLSCLAKSTRATGLDLFVDPKLKESGYNSIESSVTSLDAISGTFDIVFASNLLKHLTMEQVHVALSNFNKVLNNGGHLVILQPNFRYAYKNYFDDYTHKSIFTDKSISRLLQANGFSINKIWPAILPYSVKSVPSKITTRVLRLLIRIYSKLPYKPFAGQMLIIASKYEE